MRPLVEVFASEDSLPIKQYVFQRCSGLFIGIAALTLTRPDRPESQTLAKNLQTNSGLFAAMALMVSEQIGHGVSIEANRRTIEGIRDLYHDRWDANYAATGNHTDDMTGADIKLCKALLK